MTSNSLVPDPPILRRLSAFTDDPTGGNPAGVWGGAELPAESEMGGVTVSGSAQVLNEDSPTQRPDAERLAREFLRRVWRAPADLDAIDELMTDDYVITSAGTVVQGRAQFKEWVRRFHELLEGATNEVLEVFADASGTRVVSRWICRGRSAGIFGLPADGAPVAFSGIAIWRVRDGRLAECWVERSGLEAVRAHASGVETDDRDAAAIAAHN